MVTYRKTRLVVLCKEFLMILNKKRQIESLLVARLREKVVSERMVYLMAVMVLGNER